MDELERVENQRRKVWVTEYPMGVHLGSLSADDKVSSAIRTARKLDHAVVSTVEENGTVRFYALPLAQSR